MRLACIDIGTNTTRLLVSEHDGAVLREVATARVFADLGHVRRSGQIGAAAITQVVRATVAHGQAAQAAGATVIDVVATAGVRAAGDREALFAAVSEATGLPVRLLSEDEEGRLAFAGATHGLSGDPRVPIGVIDVGGGSTELVTGARALGVDWIASLAIGSAVLTEEYLHSDPPGPVELAAAAEHADEVFDGVHAPAVSAAYAVGGSATSLYRLVGTRLDVDTLTLVRERVTSARSDTLARSLGLNPRRARLLPAGIMLLERAVRAMGVPASIAAGGVREGVILERFAATSARPS